MIPEFDIRYTAMEDLASLEEWFQDPTACDDFPFNEKEKEGALKNWIGFSKFKASLTGMIENVPCAIGTLFLMPYRKVAHHSLLYLIVDPKHRRKGIGTSMVRNLLHLAKERFKLEGVQVEIYEPNAIMSILLKNGFEITVRQENFVKIDGCPRARILLERFFK